ncbi:hypothetical protein C8A01DRAFT_48910 [Parachaetomium inaequale]|uniref:DUF6604 domain-containing protein n=1 Tax=Parachaetomium inaequale TaxID=2588326 RepID=A0AAN6PCB4_9PEZI|nr:hypothetical protein C8A01DRAFT_48910 [Parachaetomium inaequale]
MATRNAYLAYKRDTSHLLYWIIKSSNAIIRGRPKGVNTTGEITVLTLVSLSRLIAKYISAVPPAIYRLFQSVIAARTATHAIFQQIAAENPDAEIERSNASHKRFIDALIEAFEALGGNSWKSRERDGTADDGTNLKEELDQLVFTNRFGALSLEEKTTVGGHGDDASDEGSDQEPQATVAPQRRRQARPGKGKKGKRGKKSKKQQGQAVPKAPSLDDIPLESYPIIQNKDGIITDYLMAVHALVHEWADLRSYLQGVWHEIAYDGLNGAVAGTVSNLAIAMIQRSASAMFVDFPGDNSYETVMNTITRGDPEKVQGNFIMTQYALGPDGKMAAKVGEADVDVKEQFLIYSYRDLVDFPTKRMQKEIRDWNPSFNLADASHEERLRWRRSYTINWLYDLVNIFSSVVLQSNTMPGQTHVLEDVDWSVHGPWNRDRRLFGLNQFAGAITSLAMQKPGTPIQHRILPHHVFQLQCIVDALTVSRGWSLGALRGHVLIPPAPNFRPRRDVDLFLDRNLERSGTGFLQAVDVLKQVLEKDGTLHGDTSRHRQSYDLLEGLQYDFHNWLGESNYMYGLAHIPPSRFSNTNANGLMESLELTYLASMSIWDQIPEPMSMVHLHNMLVQKGYLSRPVGLFASLQTLFQSAFFAEGKIPTTDFEQALMEVIGETGSRRATQRRRASARAAGISAADVHRILTPDANRFFRLKSNLILYRQSDWNAERIPDADIPIASMLGMLSLSQTKQTVDPATGRKRPEETDLVKRARAQGWSDEGLSNISSPWDQHRKSTEALLASFLPEGYTLNLGSGIATKATTPAQPQRSADTGDDHHGELTGRELLALLKTDIFRGVCGDMNPLSSLNYVWVTTSFMMLIMEIEKELAELRNPLDVRACETGGPEGKQRKRARLIFLALAEQEDECLSVMARVFERGRSGFMNHIYWTDLETSEPRQEKGRRQGMEEADAGGAYQCVVM